MYIDRVRLSNILKTKPSNIRKIKQSNEKIIINLWNSKELLTIELQDYKKFIDEQKQKSQKSNNGKTKGIGQILIAVGTVFLINGFTMNTTVSTGFGYVHNIGLISEQNNRIQLGGIIFIGGVILFCFDKRDS